MGGFTRGELSRTETREAAWAKLLGTEPTPDVALLQEATMPPPSMGVEPAVAEGTGGRVAARLWTPSYELIEPTTLEEAGEHGYVMSAQVALAEQALTLISLHARTQETTSARGVVDHIEALLTRLGPVLAKRPFILAGDFNSARRAHDLWPDHGHLDFFESVEADYEMHNCFWRKHGYEERTYWANCRDGGTPLQDDHIFVSADLADRVKACEVLDYRPYRGLSDHTPIWAELDLT